VSESFKVFLFSLYRGETEFLVLWGGILICAGLGPESFDPLIGTELSIEEGGLFAFFFRNFQAFSGVGISLYDIMNPSVVLKNNICPTSKFWSSFQFKIQISEPKLSSTFM
jgi:hypothetical protein